VRRSSNSLSSANGGIASQLACLDSLIPILEKFKAGIITTRNERDRPESL
jgi:hypothetical protein